MSPNGSFSTVVNTQFVLERGQGGVFGWVGGGGGGELEVLRFFEKGA